MTYEVALVAAPGHPVLASPADAATLREQTWLLGPAAADDLGAVPCLVGSLGVPEHRQHIFQSQAAALAEAERGLGVAPALSFTVREALAAGRLARVDHPAAHAEGSWSVMALPDHAQVAAAAELVRFVSTPRALQAMLRGTGVGIRRFRPAVHVTLWS
ncbi:MAG: LysR substrate-binding domain-containing protein [Kineosporiaceae bacterium]